MTWFTNFKLLLPVPQSPEHTRPTPPREAQIRTRAPSPRRTIGEGRYLLPPRVHRSSDPGFPPGTEVCREEFVVLPTVSDV